MLRFKEYLLERVDTTLNASITELFPAIAFNAKYIQHESEDGVFEALIEVQEVKEN